MPVNSAGPQSYDLKLYTSSIQRNQTCCKDGLFLSLIGWASCRSCPVSHPLQNTVSLVLACKQIDMEDQLTFRKYSMFKHLFLYQMSILFIELIKKRCFMLGVSTVNMFLMFVQQVWCSFKAKEFFFFFKCIFPSCSSSQTCAFHHEQD